MSKKSFALAMLIAMGVSSAGSLASAASGTVSGNYTNGMGNTTLGIFYNEYSYAYHDQSTTRGYSYSNSRDSLYGYLNGTYHSIAYFSPSGWGNVNWSNGNNRTYTNGVSGYSTFLGSTQPAPAWSSCGTNCTQGTKTWAYDKELFNASYSISLCGIPVTFQARVVGYASASLFSKSYSNSTASYIMNQGASTSVTGTAGVYGDFKGGVGWDFLASFKLGVTIDILNGSIPNYAYTNATCTSSGIVARSSRSRATVNVGGGGGWFYVEGCLLYNCEQWTLADWNGWSHTWTLWDSGIVNNSYDLW